MTWTMGLYHQRRIKNGMITEKETQILIDRIHRFYKRLGSMLLIETIPFNATFSWSKEAVPFEHRLAGDFKPIKEGNPWGKAWESAWFHLQANIPEMWKNQPLVAELDFSGEGLVFTPHGVALQGITNGSIFDPNFARTLVPLAIIDSQDSVELWVETAANSLFGVYLETDPDENDPNRYGHFDAKVEKMRLAIFDEDLWHFILDIRILLGLIKRLDKDSVHRARVIRSLNEAIDAFGGDRKNTNRSRSALKNELDKPANASALNVAAVGHAHIDTAWLWPVKESIRKCARTFSTQLNLIEKYPEYIFGASQPQHYQFIKDHYPEIYQRIKTAVKRGQWELQGGMWVEADCNLISGESIVRQILHGKNFFLDEFNIDVDNLWLPDVFGYSAALPQILQKSDIKYFLTQKLSWSQFNEFPHHTFKWRGIDGSEVLTHFPPENTYNSELDTEFLIPAECHFKEKEFLNEFISLFGVGDGGGGPKPENIELGKRMANLEGAPKVAFESAKNFFNRIEKYSDDLETWVGELYLEYHRGTYTTQGHVKRGNRQLEQKLRAVEFLWSCIPLVHYPENELDRIWKNTLLNQFHDILPGSSITDVYKTTIKEYKKSLLSCENLLKTGADKLFHKSDDSLVLMNLLHDTYSGTVVLPNAWNGFGVKDQHGDLLPTQNEDGRTIAYVTVEPYSFKTFYKSKTQTPNLDQPNQLILENDFIQYKFTSTGELLTAFDKEIGQPILASGQKGNIFTLYEDHPNNWDAWDIDFFYRKAFIENAKSLQAKPLTYGSVRQGIQFDLSIGNSTISQKVYLSRNNKRLDFSTTVDWKEKHKMLRVAFPTNIRSENASFDIQYGYVKRPTHNNTSLEKAKFEVVAHKYADLSDHDYGVAVLNDCKYGYHVKDNLIDLNLLRSPTNPDPDADIGQHTFTYSLYPHTGDLIHSDVISESARLNHPLILFDGYRSDDVCPPASLTGEGLSMEVLKKAEKDGCLILRIVETLGKTSTGTLSSISTKTTWIKTNLMERNDTESFQGQTLTVHLQPFEIQTWKLQTK